MIRRAIAALAFALTLGACQAEQAGDPNNGPGKGAIPQGSGYDFFVLALSWSPTHCETEGADANRQQCGARQKHGFIVHGLWPQFESGWPEFCDSNEPSRVPDAMVRANLDIMPSGSLIGHQWRKHGSCSGLSQTDYFSVVRSAWEQIVVPPQYRSVEDRLTTSPDAVERGFLSSNPGLPADGIAVTCKERYVSEARICLTKDLRFRSCPEIDQRGCRIRQATMPASN